MLPGIQALLELSRIDVQIAGLEKERSLLPATREAMAAERAKAAEAIERAEAALTEAEQEQRRQEAVVADREALVAKLEGQQHQVKTNEAYTALLSEIDHAKASISEAETGILEAMEGIEEARGEVEQARTAAKAVGERLDEQERNLADRERSFEQSLGNLRREREQTVAGVDSLLLDRYTKIASRRQPAVAIASREMCMSCRVQLPPQLVLEMKKGEQLIMCGSCQRILILEEPS